MKTPTFWEFTAGNVCTVLSVIISCVALYVTFRKYHKENKETIQQEMVERAQDRQKLDRVFCWIETNSEEFMKMKTSLEFLTDWVKAIWKSEAGD